MERVGAKLTAILFHKTFPAGLALAPFVLFIGNLIVRLFCYFDLDGIKATAAGALPFDFFECTLHTAVELPARLAPGARC